MRILFTILVCGLMPWSAKALEKPNILFVLFDDMGYGEPSCYRPESSFRTPGINRLAREGMLFTDAHASAASCTPTRYGFMAGRYPHRIGQYGVLSTFSPPLIEPERLTVASFLKKNGYATACIGKWHLGMNWGRPKVKGKNKVKRELEIGEKMTGGPNALGFDYFYGFTHARNIEMVIEQDTVVKRVKAFQNQPLMIDRAVEYLNQRPNGGKQPFFLYFPMCPPHKPVVPAERYVGKGGGEGKGSYADWVYQGDDMLVQLLDALEANDLAKDTLVIATADNGAAGRDYPPLRENKGSIYEGGHREPFLVRWPGKVKPGSRSEQIVSITDVFATCAEIIGHSLPEDVAEDSVSFLNCLLGKQVGPFRVASVQQSGKKSFALRKGKWKLIDHGDGRHELFDLEADLGETIDLHDKQPEVARELAGLLQSYLDRGRSTPGPALPLSHKVSLNEVRYKKK